jgi:hypothetical protein
LPLRLVPQTLLWTAGLEQLSAAVQQLPVPYLQLLAVLYLLMQGQH